MPQLAPTILVWARESAGLSLDAAAKKLGIKETRTGTGAERLAEIERRGGPVSRTLLQKMARVYRRPLVAFYLEEPPIKASLGEDFRTLPQRATESEPLVNALLRDVRARQEMVRAVIEDDDDSQPLSFVGSIRMEDGTPAAVKSISDALKFEQGVYRAQKSVEAAFGYIRGQAEAAGIFVLLAGNLGSHHSTLDVSSFRGFALADNRAPFVVINDQDAKTAWSFTLLHELAHLWIGSTGISGTYGESAVEKFCNEVASAILVSDSELATLAITTSDEESLAKTITEFARERMVSRTMVAYRLLLVGRISDVQWGAARDLFLREWRELQERQKAKAKASEGGPDYFVVKRHKLGPALLNFVRRSLDEGSLTPTKASKLLGVKPRSVEPLLQTRLAA